MRVALRMCVNELGKGGGFVNWMRVNLETKEVKLKKEKEKRYDLNIKKIERTDKLK